MQRLGVADVMQLVQRHSLFRSNVIVAGLVTVLVTQMKQNLDSIGTLLLCFTH
jgi:hypothetical protein